jgi:hypothetical protein
MVVKQQDDKLMLGRLNGKEPSNLLNSKTLFRYYGVLLSKQQNVYFG